MESLDNILPLVDKYGPCWTLYSVKYGRPTKVGSYMERDAEKSVDELIAHAERENDASPGVRFRIEFKNTREASGPKAITATREFSLDGAAALGNVPAPAAQAAHNSDMLPRSIVMEMLALSEERSKLNTEKMLFQREKELFEKEQKEADEIIGEMEKKYQSKTASLSEAFENGLSGVLEMAIKGVAGNPQALAGIFGVPAETSALAGPMEELEPLEPAAPAAPANGPVDWLSLLANNVHTPQDVTNIQLALQKVIQQKQQQQQNSGRAQNLQTGNSLFGNENGGVENAGDPA